MRLAGEPGQNLWKEMSCGQNLDNVRLSGMELDLLNEFGRATCEWSSFDFSRRLLAGELFFRPSGAYFLRAESQGLRPGLHSSAASRLDVELCSTARSGPVPEEPQIRSRG